MDKPKLSPDARKVPKSNIFLFRKMYHRPVVPFSRKDKNARGKTKTKWFTEDMCGNLTVTEALIRASLVIIMPIISAIDWNYVTHFMFYLAPIILYSEVTVFTMTCPIKSFVQQLLKSIWQMNKSVHFNAERGLSHLFWGPLKKLKLFRCTWQNRN